ncbi:ATP-binding protein [Dechloromonas sp. H13]|uniref:sensor histidine kinase n=1 Tax=Dechloromonas sp. H13 TaxID=2570193 RepID=UPI0012923A68|nr:ATP-binding protein [Dechloromonas sp. H13]
MIRRRPDLLALIVALAGTLAVVAVFISDLMLSREREMAQGERRVQHFGMMLGEHTARTFEAVNILLREIATDLSENHTEWDSWQPSRGWEYLATRHSRNLPQLRDLILFDRAGEQRFISTYFPSPRINVRDRPYFVALELGDAAATYGPYIGRNSGRYTYALARRIHDGRGNFAGASFAAIEPAYFQDFCWSNRLADDFESVIINARGQIVASCRPTDLSKQSPLLGALAVDALYGGKLRGWLPESGGTRQDGLIVSVSPVPDFADLRVLTVIPESSLLGAWRAHLNQLGTLAFLVTFVLLVGGLLVRRQVREMHEMTGQLASSHDKLEERVRDATLELSAQKDEAERASRAKSRFLAAASHDLRQPLHALALFAADLQRQVRSGNLGELSRLSGQISSSTGALGEMLDSLLDISRLDVAGIQPDIKAFSLNPMLERLASSFRRAAVDRNQALIFQPTRLWAESDPQMVERMVANLLSNALRYTPDGGRILVAVRRRGRNVLIEVRDNGPGIAPEHQAAIFAEFYQIGNAAREQGKGLGLGLSIIDRLARALGIEIRLRSKVGHGTTFGLLIKAAVPRTELSLLGETESRAAIHFIGEGSDLQTAMVLAGGWNHAVSHAPAPGGNPPDSRRRLIVVTLAPLAAAVRSAMPATMPVIALGDTREFRLPEGVYPLPLPVRPAKLRALLDQLQKTLAKSMP